MEKRLGFDPAEGDSEGEEQAVGAGRAMRERQRARLEQVPELPERNDTTSARAPSRRSSPHLSPAKYRRLHLPSNSDEHLPSELRRHPLILVSDSEEERPMLMPTKRHHPLRIDSESETEQPTHAPTKRRHALRIDSDSESEQLPLANTSVSRAPPPVERSGLSHGFSPHATTTPRMSQRSISSDDEEDALESAPRRHRSRLCGRRRLPANPFLEMEAEEGEEESASESENAPRVAPSQNTLTSTHSSNSDSVSNSDSDSDSDSNSDCD